MTYRRKEQDSYHESVLLTSALPYALISVSSSSAIPPAPRSLTTVARPESEAPPLFPGGGTVRGSLPCPPSLEFLKSPHLVQRLPAMQTTCVMFFIYGTFPPAVCRILWPLLLSNCRLFSFPKAGKKCGLMNGELAWKLDDPGSESDLLCGLGKITLTLWVS